jgi:polar amino acid transport system substrate-binding protein
MRIIFSFRYFTNCAVFGVLFGMTAIASAIDLKAYTEEWQPYNFVRDQEVTGISTDILKAACLQAQIDCEFQLVPWTRAYKTVQENPDTLIYSIARIVSREAQFAWIGPILPRTTWIYARTEVAAKIQGMKDLSDKRIGVIRGEASIDELLNAGVPKSALRIFNSNSDVCAPLSRVLSMWW